MKCLKYCTINKRCLRSETLYCTTNKGSKTMYVMEVSKVVFVAFTQQYIQSNVTHVKAVESSSINTIRAVMLCMSKVLKEVQNGLTHLCS